MKELRFNIFGMLIAVVATPQGWDAYALGAEGKRRPAGFVIPDFIAEDELLQFLADMFHEAAGGANSQALRIQ